MITITFCGHSDYISSVEDEKRILTILSEKVGDQDAELLLGGYGAFDAFARACGRKYQQTHPNTKLIFVTPYINTDNIKIRSNDNSAHYDAIVYPPLENIPSRFSILCRNKWMVEKADFVIAYVRHEWGGAHKTYEHAIKKQKEIFNLAEKAL